MKRALGIAGLLLACALAAPIAAPALEAPRAEYRDQVEPICQAEGEAKERIIGGVRAIPPGGADTAVKERGRRQLRASKALGHALAKLRGVPRPEIDAHRLDRWLDQISDQAGRLRKAGKAAIAGERARAQKLVVQFTNGSRKANNLVVSYEFRHCLIEEDGFTP